MSYQRCPVCNGRGIVPNGFYLYPEGQGFSSSSSALIREITKELKSTNDK